MAHNWSGWPATTQSSAGGYPPYAQQQPQQHQQRYAGAYPSYAQAAAQQQQQQQLQQPRLGMFVQCCLRDLTYWDRADVQTGNAPMQCFLICRHCLLF